MSTLKKTPLTVGQMKSLATVVGNSIPTNVSKSFADKLGRNNYLQKKLKIFWAELLKEDALIEFQTIDFDDVFNQGLKTSPVFYNDEAKKWLLYTNVLRIITIGKLPKLAELCLIEKTPSYVIESAAKSAPMTEDQLVSILYLLLVEPELGSTALSYEVVKSKPEIKNHRYLMRIKMSSGKELAVWFEYAFSEWRIWAADWNPTNSWSENTTVLYFEPQLT